MRKPIPVLLVALVATVLNQFAHAQQADASENAGVNHISESSGGFSLSLGIGVSSLDLDYEGDSERAESFLLRLDKSDGSNNYALQYSTYGNLISPFDIFDDFFDCLFSFGDDCDEQGNTTTVEDLSFLYGWRTNEDVYSIGLSYVRSDNTVNKQDDYSAVGAVINLRKSLFSAIDGIVHVNMNEEDSFAALNFTVRFD